MNIALLTAAGYGTRMHQDIPKQFLHVNNKPVIVYTMEAFQWGVCVLNSSSLGIEFFACSPSALVNTASTHGIAATALPYCLYVAMYRSG